LAYLQNLAVVVEPAETAVAVEAAGAGKKEEVGSMRNEISTVWRPFLKVSTHLDVGHLVLDLLHDLETTHGLCLDIHHLLVGL
jgi:hypothetical protein